MPKTNQPYDPQPERTDALGELAGKGYEAVPDDHTARLQSLQDRLGISMQEAPATEAIVRKMRPRRWLAIAAGIAALFVVGIMVSTYTSSEQKIAQVMSQENDNSTVETVASASEAADRFEEADFVAVSAGDVNKDDQVEPSSKLIVDTKEDSEKQNAVPHRENSPVSSLPSSSMPAPPAVVVASQKDLVASTSAIVEGNDAVQLPEAADVIAASEPPSADPTISKRRAKTEAANALADEAEKVLEEGSDEAVTSFRMERAPTTKTRQVTGEVIEPSGVPVVGATITIEETGQQAVTDQKGEFLILVDEKAVVGEIQAEGYSTFLFDVTAGEEFRIFLPRVASSLPTAQLKGKDIGLRIVAPKADRYPVFDEYISTKRSEFSGQKVVVQFYVNRFGRPRQIVSGPGNQDREALKVAKEWLKTGPDWTEPYQKSSWRYEIEFK